MRVFCVCSRPSISCCKKGKNRIYVIFGEVAVSVEERDQLINDSLNSPYRLFVAF